MYMYQLITWYTFNLHSVICQFYVNKAGGSGEGHSCLNFSAKSCQFVWQMSIVMSTLNHIYIQNMNKITIHSYILT